jgi:hypothetical protein
MSSQSKDFPVWIGVSEADLGVVVNFRHVIIIRRRAESRKHLLSGPIDSRVSSIDVASDDYRPGGSLL